MPTKDLVTKVWIDPGCIVCDACETACPEVFEVQEETCIIRPEALNMEFTKPLTEAIAEAAEECPVDVIKFDTAPFEVAEHEAAAAAGTDAEKTSPAEPVTELDASTAGLSKQKTSPQAPDGPADPALSALLRAVTARGGREASVTSGSTTSGALASLGKKRFEELPPDARYARVLDSIGEVKRSKPAADDVSRREFMNKATQTVGWSALGLTLATASGPAFARFMMPNVLEEPDPQIRIGDLETYRALEPGGVDESFKTQGIWIIRLEDRIAAPSTTCTHLGCIPNWLENDRKFKCPCHGSGFKPDGINFEGPAPRPLERLKIIETDGQVVVNKSVKFLQEQGQWGQPDSYLMV